jgi:Sortilin, neurotensin receptor 3,
MTYFLQKPVSDIFTGRNNWTHKFFWQGVGVFLLSFVWACSSVQPTASETLQRRYEPYDHFSFQRSYPDTLLDWGGWRQALRQARTGKVQERGPNDGPGIIPVAWTFQGPANIPGRVNTLAVKPDDENTVLAGFAGGGIFKSTNAGATWAPVFDEFLELSVSKIVFDPSQPNVVYAGTGDKNIPSIVYNGEGIYKSTDAGNTWQYLGLGQAGIIADIIVHPTNPQLLWAGTMGNPHQPNDERGVYRSTDGGLTWQKTLFVSNQAGCISLVMSAANPNVLYAATWDRIANNSTGILYGPNGKVFKSTDGGSSWTQLGGGLPTGTVGRVGLAVSQQNPDKVYCLMVDTLSTPGSLHLSTDGGQSWNSINIGSLENSCSNFAWYFGTLTLHPNNDNDLYFHAIQLYRRNNNGAWLSAASGHADSHDLVFCPSGRRYWANDGGVYRNEPNQPLTWIKSTNLPTTQVYRTSYNPHQPAHYYLGAQDNGTKWGNATTLNAWSSILSNDGFRIVFHPNTPDSLLVENQNGNLFRSNDNGQNWTATGTAFGTTDRVNWDAPVFRSKFPPYNLYAGTYRLLYAPPDGGAFVPVSNDLTDGIIFGRGFHNISWLSESPLQAGKLFVGTSDANVWRRDPNGSWTNLTAGLPTRYVTSVVGSPVQAQRIFTSHSGWRDGVYIPHIHRSDNNGSTWNDISGDLPQMPVNQLFIVPNHADSVLIVATDAGAYLTRNGGINWFRLGNNLPAVPVFDLVYNPVQNQLVAGTFGRGVWSFPLDSVLVLPTTPPAPSFTNVYAHLSPPLDLVQFPGFPAAHSVQSLPDTSIYLIPNQPAGSNISVRPQFNSDPLNGVNTYDLVLISRHILGAEPISAPYRLLAADANDNGQITTFDVVELRKLILGVYDSLPKSPSWRFVPASWTFADPNNPFPRPPDSLSLTVPTTDTTLHFRPYKMGDMDGNADANLAPESEERYLPSQPFPVPDRAFLAGENFQFTLAINLNSLTALQFELQALTADLAIIGVTPIAEGLTLSEHFNLRDTAQGRFRFAFERTLSPHFLEKKTALFSIELKALRNGNLASSLSIAGQKAIARSFDTHGQASVPFLFWQRTGTDDWSMYPNPVTNQGVWVQGLPTGGLLTVHDVSGRLIHSQHLGNDSIFHLDAGIFPATGGYWLSWNHGQPRWLWIQR